VLLNAFDVDPSAAERTLELQAGELFNLGIEADLLVISTRAGGYEPVPGTLVERIRQTTGIRLGDLPRQLEIRIDTLTAWLSPPLQELQPTVQWPAGGNSRFHRIAVLESAPHGDGNPTAGS
jgi:hypothetical protein